ncbi:NlpC/P60 family protein [Spirillospora sp. NPDC048911]|uniref:C40 family peptidase n=1 Tax=Spirillospora sp. NPDC048911 TaxID=3364527 RepID=UPI003716C1F8
MTLAGALVAVPAVPAHADPEPSTKELRSQAHKLADQLEQLTEQYNGLKVKLQQSQRAAKVATDNAKRQEKSLEGVREKVGSLAATSYMQGGADPTVSFVASQDPQRLLDQAATLHYFATQDGTRVQGLMQAMQAAQRARKAAEQRAKQVSQLRSQLESQRKKVTSLYEKVRGRLVKKDPSELSKLPVVGTGKAAQALRYAMSKIGRPYVWGAAGPTTFDCSGLTMWAYKQVGISLPHYTGSQWNAGTHISRNDLQPGDLVFFYGDLHHMGMYVGDGKMLHAPQTGDVVKIAPLAGRPFAGAVRVA